MGRPSKLTEERRRTIVGALRAGATWDIACRLAKVHRSTAHRWAAKGSQAKSGEYRDFHDEVKHAEAVSAVGGLQVIQAAAKDGTWQAAAWLLERRHGYRRDATFHVEPPPPKVIESPADESPEQYYARQLADAEKAVADARAEGSYQAAVNGQRMAIALREKLDAVRASEAADFAVDDAKAVADEIRELLAIPAIAAQFNRDRD
jgi:hypothetical protein